MWAPFPSHMLTPLPLKDQTSVPINFEIRNILPRGVQLPGVFWWERGTVVKGIILFYSFLVRVHSLHIKDLIRALLPPPTYRITDSQIWEAFRVLHYHWVGEETKAPPKESDLTKVTWISKAG